MIALDTETEKIADDGDTPRLVCVQLDDGAGPLLLHAEDPITPEIVGDVLRGKLTTDPFDALVLRRRYPQHERAIFEAYRDDRVSSELTREKLLDLADGAYRRRGGYSLAEVARRRARVELDKGADTWRLRYGELFDFPCDLWPEDACSYALDDAAAKIATWAAQERARVVDDFDLLQDEHRQARKALALAVMNERGLATDANYRDELEERLASEQEELREVLEEAGLVRVGGTKKAPRWVKSENQARDLVEAWATENNLKVSRGKKGASIAEKELSRLNVPEGHPLAIYQRYGSIQGLRSRVLDKLRAPVVRATWDELMATGRTSCSNPPLQQLPRDGGFREVFRARPGCQYVIRDWSSAELVSWSQVCVELFGSSSMGDAINEGLDPHLVFVARDLLEQPYADVARRYADKDPEIKPLRQLAKAANFGFLGGLGAPAFVSYARDTYGVRIDERRSYDVRARWLRGWREAPLYFAWIKDAQQHDGTANLVQLKSNRVRGGCFFTDGCNTLFQGLTADMAGDALWQVVWEQTCDETSPLYGVSWLVMFAHDEIVVETLTEHAPAVSRRLDEIMVAAGRRWCPDVRSSTEGGIVERYCKL